MNTEEKPYLECEKRWVYYALMTVGGWFGGFTVSLRGGVFCNAQTANVVMMAVSLGNGEWKRAVYYLIPMSAYFLGAALSEYLSKRVKKLHLLRWDTLLIGFEILVVFLLGLLPESAPVQITQVALNFICSMQYNTFRQAEGIPMATTFCTNHIRLAGVDTVKLLRHKDRDAGRRLIAHGIMLFFFVLGCTGGAVAARFLLGKSIWLAGLILLAVFARLVWADLTYEHNQLYRVPHGH
ncbi:MAG: DUF1275 domain-containing protein [Clostridia bacterium]|nr:DUF1275 domain-containing protein [Clostridia bacterium]